MQEKRKKVKQWISLAPKSSFYEVIDEAKLTPEQKTYMEGLFIYGKNITQLFMENNSNEATAKREIAKAYDKIAVVLDIYY